MNDLIKDADVKTYISDGVICLPNLVNQDWLNLIAEGIRSNYLNPSKFFRDQTRAGDVASYVFDYWTWKNTPEFEHFIKHGPLSSVAATFLGTNKITLLMDNWFMHEAGATNSAPWHQDVTYFDYDGEMCNMLLTLDKVPESNTIHFAKGSHRDRKKYKAIHFRDKVPFDGQMDCDYCDIPKVEENYEILAWALSPGDCLIFNLHTLHRGGYHNVPTNSITRKYSLRFGTHLTRFTPRGDWTKATSNHLMSLGQKSGAILDTVLTPQICIKDDDKL